MQVPGWPDAGLDGVMQVLGWCDAGPWMVWYRSLDGVMQVLGWCDAGPRMVWCRSPDVQILETETLPEKVGALLKKINVIVWIYGQLSSLSKVFISEWTLSLIGLSIGLNFWWLPSYRKFVSKQLGTLSFQLLFHFSSGVHNNLCLYVLEYCTVFVLTNLRVCDVIQNLCQSSLVNCEFVSQNVPPKRWILKNWSL